MEAKSSSSFLFPTSLWSTPGTSGKYFQLPELGLTEDSHQLISLGWRSKTGSSPQMLCLACEVFFKFLN